MTTKRAKKRGSGKGVPKPLKRQLDHEFPKRLREVMRHVGEESPAGFARYCGCERATIGGWLRGKPQVEALLLFQVADRCAISPRWLLLGQGHMLDGIDRPKVTAKREQIIIPKAEKIASLVG